MVKILIPRHTYSINIKCFSEVLEKLLILGIAGRNVQICSYIKLVVLYWITIHQSIISQFHRRLVMLIYNVEAKVFINTWGSKNVTKPCIYFHCKSKLQSQIVKLQPEGKGTIKWAHQSIHSAENAQYSTFAQKLWCSNSVKQSFINERLGIHIWIFMVQSKFDLHRHETFCPPTTFKTLRLHMNI